MQYGSEKLFESFQTIKGLITGDWLSILELGGSAGNSGDSSDVVSAGRGGGDILKPKYLLHFFQSAIVLEPQKLRKTSLIIVPPLHTHTHTHSHVYCVRNRKIVSYFMQTKVIVFSQWTRMMGK